MEKSINEEKIKKKKKRKEKEHKDWMLNTRNRKPA